MPLPSLKQWDEDRKTLGVVYDHSRAKPVKRKNKIKKSRQAAFKTALEDRTKPSGQLQYTETKTSDSSLDQEQCGVQSKRDEAPSQRRKENHHMIQIFIKTPIISPKNLCLRLHHNTTIFSLKQIIHRKSGIRPALQNLSLGEHQFKSCDALTLLDLDIQPGTNITLSLATGLLGGAPKPKRTVDEKFLRNLARKLGTDWQQVATNLRFTSAEIRKFKSHDESPEEQAFQMLDSWWKKQPQDREAGEWLRSVLFQTGHRDIAATIPALPGSPTPKSDSKHHSNGDKVVSEINQDSAAVEGALSETFLHKMAVSLGKDWQRLATYLGFSQAHIHAIERNCRDNLEKQAVTLFAHWQIFHTNDAAGRRTLTYCCNAIGRTDLALTLTGYAHTSPRVDNTDEVNSRQSSEHQSTSSDTSGPLKQATSVKPERVNPPKGDQTSFQGQPHALPHHGSPTTKSDSKRHSNGDKVDSEIKQDSGYAHTSPRVDNTGEVNSRQSSEHQSTSSDTPGIVDRTSRDLAKNIGGNLKQLASSLGFIAAQNERFEYSQIKQAFRMFFTWWARKQKTQKGADELTESFVKLGRKDMVQNITDVKVLPFNIEECGETLVSHYKAFKRYGC